MKSSSINDFNNSRPGLLGGIFRNRGLLKTSKVVKFLHKARSFKEDDSFMTDSSDEATFVKQ